MVVYTAGLVCGFVKISYYGSMDWTQIELLVLHAVHWPAFYTRGKFSAR